jgi:hypothetical protein
VRHHQEPDSLHAKIPRQPEVLDRHVRLCAVRRDPGYRSASLARAAQVIHGADARNEQDGDRRLPRLLHAGPDEVQLVLAREAVIERRAAKTVAVRHLDDGHAGRVQRVHRRADLLGRELVRHRVTAVPQRGVSDAYLAASAVQVVAAQPVAAQPVADEAGHAVTAPVVVAPVAACAARRCAMTSPTLAAAAVMMSRLPA